jgi:Kelch motif
VLVTGGWIAPQTSTASAEVIDARRGTVRPAADLPWAADALDAVSLPGGRVLVTGGRTAVGGTTAAAVFGPATGRWASAGPMATPRFKHASALPPGGRVLVIGGTTDDRRILDSTEVFDPRTGRFSPGAARRTPRYKLPGGQPCSGTAGCWSAGAQPPSRSSTSTGPRRAR